ncbi:MAG: [FeFe] hydrogenase H-cluster radical SAM maturase HydE [Kiritimatiellia bacterium]
MNRCDDLGLARILEKAQGRARALTQGELVRLLAVEREEELAALFDAAYAVKTRTCGKRVSIRGLVEVGNICAKDCLYCGIRKSNAAVRRYHLTVDDVVRLAEEAKAFNYASLVLQSGEIENEANTAFFEEALRRIAPLDMGVTLSLGEQTEEVFRRWRSAGAARYLLRIETSNPDLYRTLHPAGHDWARRVECLRALRRCGYQVGTGVMCGLPGQTLDDLARDILFYDEIDADMIGMGPYIPHPDTPLGARAERGDPQSRLLLGLKMIAATRLYLHDVNIAASTALQALAEDGRERGIRAGANVVMPNVTETRYRRSYQLYEGKPALNENAETSRDALERRLAEIGETIAYGVRGDSPHYRQRRAAEEDEKVLDA